MADAPAHDEKVVLPVDPAAFMDDPEWAAFIPDVPSGGPKCRLPAHTDCTPLDVERVAGHLTAGGTLGAIPGYEARPGQLDMTRAVTRAYNDRRHLMVEAGTGVGKSLAYLVPSVQWSFLNDTPVILSTATRNLQSQLVRADLPRAAQTLGDDAPKFRATLLKGRANYLCLRLLGEYMQGGYWTLAVDEQVAFKKFLAWLFKTPDGDFDDFGDDDLRAKLTCSPEDCLGRGCRYHEKCFVTKARTRAQKAHIVVANHALVLAEAANPGSGILPAYGRLVFDEAHNLEDIATEFFSYELSRPVLLQLLGRLSRPGKSRRGPSRMRGVLGSIERQLQKGYMPESVREDIRELVTRAAVQSKFVQAEASNLFDLFEKLFSPAPQASVIRIRKLTPEDPARQYALQGIFTTYTPAQWDEAALVVAAKLFESKMAGLQSVLVELAKLLNAAAADANAAFLAETAGQVEGLAINFTQFILESKFVLAACDPSRVYWAERMPPSKKAHQPAHVRLVAAPLSIAKEMKQCFYDTKDTVVMCSATLRAGDKFDYMARKLGLSLVEPERLQALVAASPFDYFRQALALATDFLPDPGTAKYPAALAAVLRDIFFATRGRGLVLFTAYDMMRAVAEQVRPLLDTVGIDLLVQGEGASREGMVAALKAACDEPTGRMVVLFGAQSFWEGVDVPGEALSCVVLARLPFPQVGEPINEARSEKITESGGSSFRDFMIPEALIRFRQGFGRLVRTQRDRGVVVITDARIVAKNYGAMFRKAVPASVHTVSSGNDLNARISDFFAAEEKTP